MAYRTPLEARLAKHVTKAIVEYGLIEHGDRVMVGLSGGKDSWALLQILDVLRQRAPIDFSLIAVNVDSGYKDYEHDVLTDTCKTRGWELRIEHTTIGEVMDNILEREHPHVKASMMTAMSNVKPRHLLDRRLADHAPTSADAPADEVKFGELVSLRGR